MVGRKPESPILHRPAVRQACASISWRSPISVSTPTHSIARTPGPQDISAPVSHHYSVRLSPLSDFQAAVPAHLTSYISALRAQVSPISAPPIKSNTLPCQSDPSDHLLGKLPPVWDHTNNTLHHSFMGFQHFRYAGILTCSGPSPRTLKCSWYACTPSHACSSGRKPYASLETVPQGRRLMKASGYPDHLSVAHLKCSHCMLHRFGDSS